MTAHPQMQIPPFHYGMTTKSIATVGDDSQEATAYPPRMPSRREYHFWVYIMASRSLQLYIGMTNNLRHRVEQHKSHRPGTYTARYHINRLVYFEHFQYVQTAIARETELKDWNRAKKLALITAENPTWIDLTEAWADSSAMQPSHKSRANT